MLCVYLSAALVAASSFFFFNDTATTEIYTLSLHDALPIFKEIFEQPEAVRNTLRERVDHETPDVRIPELGLKDRELAGLNRLCLVACGTSWHAALVGKYLVEAFARLPVEADISSEVQDRRPVVDSRVLNGCL